MRVTKQLVENMVTKIASEVNPTKCTCSVPWREEMKMLVQMWIQENISVEDGLTSD